MKTKVLAALNNFSEGIDTAFLMKISKQFFIAPVYHLVSDVKVPHIRHLYPIRTVKQFKEDVDFFLRYYTPLSLNDLVKSIRNETELPRNSFFLSFDDGLRECYDVVAPILKEKGLPATFFLNSSFIDNQGLFFKYKISLLIEEILSHPNAELITEKVKKKLEQSNIQVINIAETLLTLRYVHVPLLNSIAQELGVDFDEYLKKHRPYLSFEQVQSLINQGHTIGAHSIDHPHYMDLLLAEQLRQTEESVTFIQQKFSLNYKVFAFPFTDFGVKKALFEKLYSATVPIVDLSFGVAGIKKDVLKQHIHRIAMERTAASAKQTINTEILYYLCKAIVNKNKIIRS